MVDGMVGEIPAEEEEEEAEEEAEEAEEEAEEEEEEKKEEKKEKEEECIDQDELLEELELSFKKQSCMMRDLEDSLCMQNVCIDDIGYDAKCSREYYKPKKKSAVMCLLSAAAAGTSLEPHLDSIRWFRDHIMPVWQVNLYYNKISPPIAHWLQDHPSAKRFVRAITWPIVLMLEHPGDCLMLFLIPLLSILFFFIFFINNGSTLNSSSQGYSNIGDDDNDYSNILQHDLP